MAAHEHHAQTVIVDVLLGKYRILRRRVCAALLHQTGDFNFLVAEDLVPSDEIERQIFRHLSDPGGRISRDAVGSFVLLQYYDERRSAFRTSSLNFSDLSIRL
jgi:hypothetical protein